MPAGTRRNRANTLCNLRRTPHAAPLVHPAPALDAGGRPMVRWNSLYDLETGEATMAMAMDLSARQATLLTG